MKRLAFLGNARADLRKFPELARRKAGFQLGLIQDGFDPEDWKPMSSIGKGVREIRIKELSGAFRVIYVASFGDAIFVLHAFQKKTQRTSMLDIELAKTRFKQLLRETEK